ncbi:MAG TPA: Rrf2 family transcriptional regulator [Chloroflexota bacterium]
MRISSRSHYGLRAMTELAKAYHQGPLPLSEIAQVEHLPLPYLEQVIATLREAGLVEATRGRHGGYRLSRPPAQITVGEVVRVLEGPIALVDCVADDYVAGSCEVETKCVSRVVWQRVKDSINSVLNSTTLADLCGEPGPVERTPLTGIAQLS